ncbi:MAG TPA: DUF5606 domain-containing protein [Chitinophagaceae bacterium]
MEYGKIIAITGLPGLYEMMNSKGDGAIVRSLDDQSTKFVSGRVHQFTHLESIEVYTERENVNLVEVLNAMKDSGEKLPDEKDGKALQAYFKKVYPALDFERVYASDMKKMVKWFNVLVKNEVDIKLSEPEEEPVEETEADEAVEGVAVNESEAKPAKKAKPKKEEKEEPVKEKATKAKETKPAEKPKETKAKPAAKAKTAKEKEPAKSKASKAAPAKKAAAKKAAKKKK